MVSVKTENGKIVMINSIPVANDVAEKLKAIIKSKKKVVTSMLKDLGIDHWLETKGNETISITSRKFSIKDEIDVLAEVDSLQKTHQKLAQALMGMEPEKPESHPEETTDTPDDEAEKFLSYALVCKLQELVDSCGAIIIALPK